MISGSARRVLHRQDVGADALAQGVFLRRHAFARGHDRLELAQIDDDVAAFEAAHCAGDDRAHAVLELVEDHRPLDAAQRLRHRLLEDLRRDAAQLLRVDIDLDDFAQRGIGLHEARLLQADFVVRNRRLFHHGQPRHRARLARLGVKLDDKVLGRAEALLGGGHQRGMHGLMEKLALDAAFLFHVIENSNKFLAHNNFPFVFGSRACGGDKKGGKPVRGSHRRRGPERVRLSSLKEGSSRKR